MAFRRRSDSGSESGIALFMVLSAMTILAVLVTEFTYIAQVNSRMAFDSLDQVKAHYLAKSGLKLSLIRIRAYQNLSALAKNTGGGAGAGMVPKGMLEKIWSFPFFYPIPTEIPGLTPSEKDQITKFTQETAIDGRFSALIESESNRFNLNSLLAPFATIPSPTATPTPTPTRPPRQGSPAATSPAASPTPAFNPIEAQQSLATYLTQILNNKIETDEEFASEYRDLRVDEFVDNIISWIDPTHERRSAPSSSFRPKGGPLYSLSELRMIEPIDDRLFEALAPHFTVSAVPGLNVNTVKDSTLRALFPQITQEEVVELIQFRDSAEQDNSFKTPEDFFSYLRDHVSAFLGSQNEIDALREDLKRRNIQIVTDETHFKVTVQAIVNQATRVIEAQIMVVPPRRSGPQAQPGGPAVPQQAPTDSGLRITSMRIL